MAKKKSFSPAAFWAKQIVLAVILIAIAAFVINSQNNKVAKQREQPKRNIDSSLSDFYAAHRMSSTEPIKEELGDFVMDINRDDKPLNARLKQMEKEQAAPIGGRWVGEHKYRTFRAGSTLREAITSYAQEEGMQVIWELDQDFIVKSQFQMDDTIVGSLYKISRAVNANFNGEVNAYVCPKQRSLVITADRSDYLDTNCSLASTSG